MDMQWMVQISFHFFHFQDKIAKAMGLLSVHTRHIMRRRASFSL